MCVCVCVCVFAVHPFNAVYNYTPSKLPSSVATRVEPRLTREVTDNHPATITDSVSGLSLFTVDVGTNGNGGSVECGLEPSSVGSDEGIETMVVYSRRADNEACRPPWGYPQSSGIRRSCSLDGVGLASRYHGDDVIYQRGSVESSDDETGSQGCVVFF